MLTPYIVLLLENKKHAFDHIFDEIAVIQMGSIIYVICFMICLPFWLIFDIYYFLSAALRFNWFKVFNYEVDLWDS